MYGAFAGGLTGAWAAIPGLGGPDELLELLPDPPLGGLFLLELFRLLDLVLDLGLLGDPA